MADGAVTTPKTDLANVDPVTQLVNGVFFPQRRRDVMGLGGSTLDNVSWHDFSEHQYLLPPVPATNRPGYLGDLYVFEPGTFNLGLQLVHRQEWRCLGNQRGEIVRTIPLGPRQVEKVNTKVVRRSKVARSGETVKVFETTTESTETTKDSSEVVAEAASSSKWHTDVNASMNFGGGWIGGSVGVAAGLSGNLGKKSRETNSRLSETMQKTASRMRSETKVVVSTESESTIEAETASEITNPNEEIALTYIYSKLQRQYEVFTGLSEVHDVVFVALPLPDQINFSWVTRHDWIIGEVLLDESFRDTLDLISSEPAPIDESAYAASLSVVDDQGDAGLLHTLGHSTLQSMSLAGTDISQLSERRRDSIRAERERERVRKSREHRLQRLYRHIEQNMLHYMRAIWAREDPEQQLLQLRARAGVTIPNNWMFYGYYGDEDANKSGASVGDVLTAIVRHEAAAAGHIGEQEPAENDDRTTSIELLLQGFENKARTEIWLPVPEQIEGKYRLREEQATAPIEAERERLRARVTAMARDVVIRRHHPDFEQRRDGIAALQRELAERCRRHLDYVEAVERRFGFRLTIRRDYEESNAESMRAFLGDTWEWLDQLVGWNTGRSRMPPMINKWALHGGVALEFPEVITAIGIDMGTDRSNVSTSRPDLLAAQDELKALDVSKSRAMHVLDEEAYIRVALATPDEVPKEVDEQYAEIKERLGAEFEDLERRLDDIDVERIAEITERQAVFDEYLAAELQRRREWLRWTLHRAPRRAFYYEGDFAFDDEPVTHVADLIHPSGPIGFVGNYAVYFLKPEVTPPDVLDLLAILKTPYLYYEEEYLPPELVDPALKELMQQYGGVTPEPALRDEMADEVPELRLRMRLAELDEADARATPGNTRTPLADFFGDDALFREFYPEFVFRREMTRRFPVDTNNLVVDIEPGTGTALEPFKIAHRGIDVLRANEEKQTARLENERMRALIEAGQLDARYWPEPQKVLMFGDADASAAGGPIAVVPGEPPPTSSASPVFGVFGRVQDDRNRPIAGALIRATAEPLSPAESVHRPLVEQQAASRLPVETATATDGLFWVALPAGRHQLVASKSDHDDASVAVAVRPGTPATMTIVLRRQIKKRPRFRK